jgi:hypothetical protein
MIVHWFKPLEVTLRPGVSVTRHILFCCYIAGIITTKDAAKQTRGKHIYSAILFVCQLFQMSLHIT